VGKIPGGWINVKAGLQRLLLFRHG